jgi:dihydrofolate reductase
MTVLVLIAAIARNGIIGATVDGKCVLPWRLPEDLKHFKALTLGHPIIMGRKTWESLGRPLPGRHNIVITRNPAYVAAGADVVGSLATALAACSASDTAFVIGGAEIYVLALPVAQRMEFTEVQINAEGDAVFPPFDPALWSETHRESHQSAAGISYNFVSYQRKSTTFAS